MWRDVSAGKGRRDHPRTLPESRFNFQLVHTLHGTFDFSVGDSFLGAIILVIHVKEWWGRKVKGWVPLSCLATKQRVPPQKSGSSAWRSETHPKCQDSRQKGNTACLVRCSDGNWHQVQQR